MSKDEIFEELIKIGAKKQSENIAILSDDNLSRWYHFKIISNYFTVTACNKDHIHEFQGEVAINSYLIDKINSVLELLSNFRCTRQIERIFKVRNSLL